MIQPVTGRHSRANRLSALDHRLRRKRLMCVCVLSLCLLLSATAVVQSAAPAAGAVVTSQSVQSHRLPGSTHWWRSIGLGILLLVILVTSICAILVFSRRFREYLKSESRKPTPSDDVWAMHKLADWEDSDRAIDEDESDDTPSNGD